MRKAIRGALVCDSNRSMNFSPTCAATSYFSFL